MKSPRVYLVGDFLLKFAGILTAVSVAVATLGIPLPLPIAKQVSEWFPCMHCGCGCASAETCWRQCCCYSDSEKVALASEHGVKVPDFLLARVAPKIEQSESADLANLKPCCRQRVSASRQPTTCDRETADLNSISAEDAPLAPGVLAIHALKCQGNSLSLSLLPPSVPTDEIGTELPLSPCEVLVLAEGNLYQPPFFDAVVPPPEFAVS